MLDFADKYPLGTREEAWRDSRADEPLAGRQEVREPDKGEGWGRRVTALAGRPGKSLRVSTGAS